MRVRPAPSRGTSGPAAAEPAQLSARTATYTAGVQLAARALGAVIAVTTTAIVTRAVGVADYADWATALTLVVMVSFVMDPGITPVIVRRLVQDPASCPHPRALLALRAGLAAAAGAAVVVVVVGLRGAGVALLAAVLAAQLVPRAVALNVGAFLQADHRVHRQAILEVATAALGLAALAALAAAGAPAAVLALAGVTAPLFLLAVVMQRELVRTPSLARVTPGDDRARVRSIVREVAPLALALLLVSLYTRAQVVFVNASEGALGVAEYLLAFQVVEQLLVVAAIVAATLMPFLADRARSGSLHADPLSHTVLVGVAAAGTFGTAVILLVAEPAMRLIGGRDLAGGADFLVLLAPMAAALLLAVALGYVYTAMGLGRRYLRFNVVGLGLTLAGNAAFTLTSGAEAAARVTWATEFAVVSLALAAVWRSGRGGRAAVLRIAGLGAAAAVASEGVSGGVLPPAVAALLVTAVGLGLGGRALIGLAARFRSPGAESPA